MAVAKKNDISVGLEILKKSKVINQNVTLRELMELAQQLEEAEGFGDGKTSYTWTFISKHFIYKGTQPSPPKKAS